MDYFKYFNNRLDTSQVDSSIAASTLQSWMVCGY
jgi:hypothetical protein